MEVYDLFKWQETITSNILAERFHDITVPGLTESIEEYKELVGNYAAALRQNRQLTHQGRLIKTKPDLKTIILAEGWGDLLKDMEDENDA